MLRVADRDVDLLADMCDRVTEEAASLEVQDAFSCLTFTVTATDAGDLIATPPTPVARDGRALHPIAVVVLDLDAH